ncbi:class I SAM-dependent methyltransferase [Spongiimicrobium sp. 3-5]|uniref:class I SAM-dependent methyltransferase n=1 Tax=Spongiimicrobium sp. 3-5 TaxID=3332596 RepID=UPI003980486F
MKKIKDKFSQQAKHYQKFRPTYPTSLYKEILGLTETRDRAWDCGTGNGQVAIELAHHFVAVDATDISAKQLQYAKRANNINYSQQRAEETKFNDNIFDLITVAQAAHWFDMEGYNREFLRVAKNGALIALWGYGLLRINAEIDFFIDQFYSEIVGPYWNMERKHVDNAYRSIPFHFQEIQLNEEHSITAVWTISQLQGYLNSWSSVQNYRNDKGVNPVDAFMDKLVPHWKNNETKGVRFPIFTRVGRVRK